MNLTDLECQINWLRTEDTDTVDREELIYSLEVILNILNEIQDKLYRGN